VPGKRLSRRVPGRGTNVGLRSARDPRAPARTCELGYRVPRDQLRIEMLSSCPDALAGTEAPGAPL
jgi:hypothetical protein